MHGTDKHTVTGSPTTRRCLHVSCAHSTQNPSFGGPAPRTASLTATDRGKATRGALPARAQRRHSQDWVQARYRPTSASAPPPTPSPTHRHPTRPHHRPQTPFSSLYVHVHSKATHHCQRLHGEAGLWVRQAPRRRRPRPQQVRGPTPVDTRTWSVCDARRPGRRQHLSSARSCRSGTQVLGPERPPALPPGNSHPFAAANSCVGPFTQEEPAGVHRPSLRQGAAPDQSSPDPQLP